MRVDRANCLLATMYANNLAELIGPVKTCWMVIGWTKIFYLSQWKYVAFVFYNISQNATNCLFCPFEVAKHLNFVSWNIFFDMPQASKKYRFDEIPGSKLKFAQTDRQTDDPRILIAVFSSSCQITASLNYECVFTSKSLQNLCNQISFH